MRVSFDLDEVLFVSPQTHKTEPPLPFPLNRFFRERLRLGTPELIRSLQELGYGIVNGERHLREVQRGNSSPLPQKLPNRYRISLHVDDESVVCSWGREYGYETYQLNAQDDDWKEKILQRAKAVQEKERRIREQAPSF